VGGQKKIKNGTALKEQSSNSFEMKIELNKERTRRRGSRTAQPHEKLSRAAAENELSPISSSFDLNASQSIFSSSSSSFCTAQGSTRCVKILWKSHAVSFTKECR
jgi:hypothetical protein